MQIYINNIYVALYHFDPATISNILDGTRSIEKKETLQQRLLVRKIVLPISFRKAFQPICGNAH